MRDYKLTPAQVGRLLNRSGEAVRNMIMRGELPAIRVGRHFRINERDFEAYLVGQQVVPTLEPRRFPDVVGQQRFEFEAAIDQPQYAADIDPSSYEGADHTP
jgi:excisionase family DNA binding protein